jgi:hypothetical protein
MSRYQYAMAVVGVVALIAYYWVTISSAAVLHRNTPGIGTGSAAIVAIQRTEGLLQGIGPGLEPCHVLLKGYALGRCPFRSDQLRGVIHGRLVAVAEREQWTVFNSGGVLAFCTRRGVVVSVHAREEGDHTSGHLYFHASGNHSPFRDMPAGCVGEAPAFPAPDENPRPRRAGSASPACAMFPEPLRASCQ